jgi:hypothetical protein
MNFSWNDDDQDAGRQILEKNISAFEQNGVGSLLTLKLHPKKDKAGHITNVTPHYASIQFRPAELERAMYNPRAITGVDTGLSERLRNLEETNNLILSKLSEQEFEVEEEKPNYFENLLTNPQIHGLMIAGISKFLGIDNSSVSGMPGAIAGLNELNENEVFEIVSSLMSKGVTIEHLRKLNQMDSSKLSYLLNML